MRPAPFVACILFAMALLPPTSPQGSSAAPGATPARRVVVLELFTSEGCSSCPPADAVIQAFERDQPVAGVEVVALEEHVDYWDDLGWPDPFSSAVFTQRQRAFGRGFGLRSIYTPQLVVDGAVEVLGSDRKAVREAVERRALAPSLPISLRLSGERLHVSSGAPPGAARVVLAITEAGHSTAVPRGENAGETLHHGSVVRHLATVHTLPGGAPHEGDVALPPRGDWHGPRRAIVFVEDGSSAVILGAATLALP